MAKGNHDKIPVSFDKFDLNDEFETKAVNLYGNWVDTRVGKDAWDYRLNYGYKATNQRLDFALLDPVDCFKFFKGVNAPSLAEPNKIQPIIKFDLNDKRLIETKDVLSD